MDKNCWRSVEANLRISNWNFEGAYSVSYWFYFMAAAVAAVGEECRTFTTEISVVGVNKGSPLFLTDIWHSPTTITSVFNWWGG